MDAVADGGLSADIVAPVGVVVEVKHLAGCKMLRHATV
jgi:hypothetical protein